MKFLSVPLVSFLLLLGSISAVGQSPNSPAQPSIDSVVKAVKPALVRIYVVSTEYWEGRAIKVQSAGSGAIITPEGHVITNHHVAGHATQLICTLSNREEIPAKLIGTDPATDIAIIQLLPKDGRKFPVATFGDSDAVEVGDYVMAMGSPMALSQSVTLGIVSNTELVMPRRMGFGSFDLDGENVGGLVRWIAHDAFIFGGNSGGPLVDMSGSIIGINEISIALGGAIPGNLAKAMAESIMETGKVERSWLGLKVQPMLKMDDSKTGVLVTGAVPESPADLAGVESGDILLTLNGDAVYVRFDEDLPTLNGMLANLPIGKEIELEVMRGGSKKSLHATAILRENRKLKDHELREWGITAQNISFVMSKELKRDTREGVYISSIRPGGPAGDAKPRLRSRDVIIKMGDRDIPDFATLQAVTEESIGDSEDPVPVLTTFVRGTETLVTVVNVGIRELNDPGLEVKKAWLPVKTQVLTRDIAKALGTPDRKGFRVIHVYPESTADKAGLQEGDIIYSVDDEALTADAPEHYEELPALIRAYRAGTTITLGVQRDGKPTELDVELIRSPKLRREMKKYRDDNFEFTVRDTTFFDDADRQWEGKQEGVLVDEVVSGSWAALGMLQTNDLIQAVGDTSVDTSDSLQEAMETIAEQKPDSVVFKVLRGIYTLYIELEPKWEN
ncbi:MAG: PDZ domain-containing protein [Candidatus Hydrogenedentota bacterium]